EGLERLDDDRHVEVEIREARHAHEPRRAVDLRRAGAALARLAVPARGEVGRRLRLDLVDRVEDDHAGRDLGGVVLEAALAALAAPDAESCHLNQLLVSRALWRAPWGTARQ